MLLHEVVEFAALKTPRGTALIFEGRSWTFAELWSEIEAFSERLVSLVEPGERVCIISDNRPEMVAAMYAVPKVGAIAMFANTRLVPSEIIDLISDVEPVVVIGSADQIERVERLLDKVPSVTSVLSFEAFSNLPIAPRNATHLPQQSDPQQSDTAWIIHTSGTTGRPKGALLTHQNLMAGVMATALARPVGPNDSYLFPFPLFHVAAYGVVHLHFRSRPVVLVPKFDAVEVMAAVQEHQVTTISLAPTMIAMLLEHPERSKFDLTSLRHIFYGASAIPLDVLRRGLAEFGCDFGQGYGMTELSGNVAFLDADAHRRAASDAPHLLSAAGKVGPLAAIRLVADCADAGVGVGGGESGSIGVVDVAAGEPGEILIRGDQVISGYWNRHEANADGYVDGWFRTGDVGRLDEDGYLYIVDRRKDIIVSGGENVASLEVEDVLSEHPDIAQVAVVGVPDERWGERVVAVAVPRPGAKLDPAEVLDWVTGRVAGFKRPRQVLVVDELPANASGKVLKREVREMAAKALG